MKFLHIQSLRGIAALMVCIFHLAGHRDEHHSLLQPDDPLLKIASFGPTGVFVFFVISGFIIPFAMDRAKYTIGDFFSFFKKRLWRLHPPYVLVVLITLGLILFNNSTGKTNEELSAGRVISHFFYLTKVMGWEWFNPIFWTLAIEIQYYLLLALAFSWFNSELLWKRATFIAVLLCSTYLLKDDRFILFYIGPFVIGFALYYFSIKKHHLLECMLYAIGASINIYLFVGPHWLIAALCAAAFVLWVKETPRFLHYLGETSYSLYLTHPLFGGLFIYLLLPFATSVMWGYLILIGAILFSVLCAHLFYWLIEKRSIEWSRSK